MEAGNPVLLVHLSFFALTPTQWPRLYATPLAPPGTAGEEGLAGTPQA